MTLGQVFFHFKFFRAHPHSNVDVDIITDTKNEFSISGTRKRDINRNTSGEQKPLKQGDNGLTTED